MCVGLEAKYLYTSLTYIYAIISNYLHMCDMTYNEQCLGLFHQPPTFNKWLSIIKH